MPIRHLGIVMVAGVLSACANTQTSCPLNNEYGYCASVGETSQAAVAGGGSNENVLEGKHSTKIHASGDSSPKTAQQVANKHPLFEPGPGRDLAGPIYRPAQPRRLWVAPWTDANGVLHSGEYLYFLRPGHWRYGPLKSPGAAAGIMGPVAPDDLGFTPGPAKAHDASAPGDIQKPARTIQSNASSSTSGNPFPVSQDGKSR